MYVKQKLLVNGTGRNVLKAKIKNKILNNKIIIKVSDMVTRNLKICLPRTIDKALLGFLLAYTRMRFISPLYDALRKPHLHKSVHYPALRTNKKSIGAEHTHTDGTTNLCLRINI
jgi:hypothetical protein